MLYPSKKVLSVLILTMAMVVAIIIGFGKDKGSKPISFAKNLVAGEKITVPSNTEWQKELNSATKNLTTVESKTSGDDSTTDLVSISLVSNYLALKQSDTLDQASAQKLVDQGLDYINKTSNQLTKVSQLNVIPDDGKQSIIEYGEKLGRVFENNRPETIKNELEIISIAVRSGNQSKVDELDSIIAVYKNIAKELLAMPVPQTFVRAHSDMVNGSMGLVAALSEVKNVFKDPIKSMVAMQIYQDNATIFVQSIRATVDFIEQNKIIYKQGSGGYYLLQAI